MKNNVSYREYKRIDSLISRSYAGYKAKKLFKGRKCKCFIKAN